MADSQTTNTRPYWVKEPQHPNVKCDACSQPWTHEMWDILDHANSIDASVIDVPCGFCKNIIHMESHSR